MWSARVCDRHTKARNEVSVRARESEKDGKRALWLLLFYILYSTVSFLLVPVFFLWSFVINQSLSLCLCVHVRVCTHSFIVFSYCCLEFAWILSFYTCVVCVLLLFFWTIFPLVGLTFASFAFFTLFHRIYFPKRCFFILHRSYLLTRPIFHCFSHHSWCTSDELYFPLINITFCLMVAETGI